MFPYVDNKLRALGAHECVPVLGSSDQSWKGEGANGNSYIAIFVGPSLVFRRVRFVARILSLSVRRRWIRKSPRSLGAMLLFATTTARPVVVGVEAVITQNVVRKAFWRYLRLMRFKSN